MTKYNMKNIAKAAIKTLGFGFIGELADEFSKLYGEFMREAFVDALWQNI